MLGPEDFEKWLTNNFPMVQWSEAHRKLTIMFATEIVAPYQQLIADIVTHVDAQAKGRYASTKDEHEVVDQLNDRIMEALNVNLQGDHDPLVSDPTGSQAAEAAPGPSG